MVVMAILLILTIPLLNIIMNLMVTLENEDDNDNDETKKHLAAGKYDGGVAAGLPGLPEAPPASHEAARPSETSASNEGKHPASKAHRAVAANAQVPSRKNGIGASKEGNRGGGASKESSGGGASKNGSGAASKESSGAGATKEGSSAGASNVAAGPAGLAGPGLGSEAARPSKLRIIRPEVPPGTSVLPVANIM